MFEITSDIAAQKAAELASLQTAIDAKTEELASKSAEFSALEDAVSKLAESQERLASDISDLKKGGSSVKLESSTEPAVIITPIVKIGKDDYQIKYPSFRLDGVEYNADDLARDKDALEKILSTNPELFIKQ